ncbi:MAG TPA: hypothetical protein VG939_20125 [Caulobacteraceae bacterium]|nr:hypothetical protein [Caulobacteraceae bacterium]
MAGKTTVLAMIAGAAMWLLVAAIPGTAAAQCCAPPSPPPSCNCSPPPCCSPPSPPPVTPPCCTPGHNINIPGVNVNVGATVVVNANVQANARAGAGAQSTVFYGGGGGGGYIAPPMSTGVIQGLNVEGMTRRTAYEATRSMFKKVVIQAFCFDDKEVPHPASQVTPDRDIEDSYDGELYRCIAGTHMQITVAQWKEHISFEGGQTISCAKGEALYHVPGRVGPPGPAGPGGAGASLQCRPQKPARDCNERSLLRRFGAGIKILTIMYTERYTAYREESTGATAAMGMSLDGGVGGVAY